MPSALLCARNLLDRYAAHELQQVGQSTRKVNAQIEELTQRSIALRQRRPRRLYRIA